MITRSVKRALEQLEYYDLNCVIFAKKPYFILDNDKLEIISDYYSKPSDDDIINVKSSVNSDSVFTTKVQLSNGTLSGTVGGTLYISGSGLAYFVPNSSGDINVSFNKLEDVKKVQSYIIDNSYDLDIFIKEHDLENKEYVVFRVSDGESFKDPESDGIFHKRNKESKRIEIWYPGIKAQI